MYCVYVFLGIPDLLIMSTMNIWIYKEATLYNRIIGAKE